jgi:type IV pilus assembly protein PilA
MLILGILAAIALPAFFNQKDKANDAKAKEYAHSAQVAMETYATDHNGSYLNATVNDLKTIEPTLSSANIEIVSATATGYNIKSKASATQTFSVVNSSGTLTFPCTVPGKGGCPKTGEDAEGNPVGGWGG